MEPGTVYFLFLEFSIYSRNFSANDFGVVDPVVLALLFVQVCDDLEYLLFLFLGVL